MKGIKYFVVVLLLVLASCDKAFENGELDGMWRLERVEMNDAELFPENIYFSFQRHLVMLGAYYEQASPLLYMAEFDYLDGAITMQCFYKHPGIDGECSMEDLAMYYIFNSVEVFYVDVLNDKTLLMHTGDGRSYSFRRW